MHSLNFDHDFSKQCKSGNHMMEDRIWPKQREAEELEDLCDDGQEHRFIDGTYSRCGKSQ